MVDESTDISVTQNLILYATYLDEFQPKKAFLGMLSLPQADAKIIVAAIHDKLNKSNLDLLKMVAFESDGAAVMIGCRTGVATRLKEQHPYMTSIHCVAHRTNLCVASIAKHPSCKLICEKIDKLINGAATYFSNSSLRGRYLRELEEELAYSTLRLENISTTRWLSRHNAVQKLCEVFEPAMLVFKDNSVNLYQELREFKVVYILHFLADILKHLSILSLDFQKDWVDVTAIGSLVKTTKKYIELEFLDEVSILDLNGYLKDSKGYPVIPDFGTPKGYLGALRGAIKGNMYRSVELIRDVEGNDLLDAIEFQKVFSKCVLDALDERFAEQEILSCFKILSPAYVPRAAKELKEFGLDELNQLLKFYGEPRVVGGITFDSLISEDKIRMEFRKFKIQASTEWQGKNLLDTWSIILSQKMLREDEYAELAKLATIAMVQCSSIAICERGFSHMNHIKDKYRNRLQTTGLDALLRVAVEGPPMEAIDEFDFDDSIRHWKAGKKYRHIFSGCSSTSAVQTNANIGSESDIEEME